MKILFTLLCLFGILSAQAQLPDGSVCPDFTGVDIDGNTWNLYDLLDEGKTVIIDVSATWCGPCWSYHETGALEDLYADYGPDGTDEMMVLWIEGDANTNEDCIYDLEGCNSTTMGDWTDGTDYPIIDDASIADLLEIAYYPTIYQVCPSRFITELGQMSAADIYAANVDCPSAFGENNAGIVEYIGESGIFCNELEFAPGVQMQNLGSSNLTSATVELWINFTLTETVNWTGDLSAWGLAEIEFASILVAEDTELEITITDVNGVADEDESNNEHISDLVVATSTSDNYLSVEIFTDNYPSETTWELLSPTGSVLYSGGPYSAAATLISTPTPLPTDGCYEFIIYDSFGDGVSDVGGYYNVVDSDGNLVVEGVSNFGTISNDPISIEGGITVVDAGGIVGYSGESGSICVDYSYNAVITIQNQGSNEVTSALIEVSNGTGVILSQSWEGNLAASETTDVVLDEISFNESTTLTFSLVEVNGVDAADPSVSAVVAEFVQDYAETDSETWTMELQLDSYAYEIYWQISSSNGDVIASGGNEVLGELGIGGQGVAGPTDPGVYAASELVEITIDIPEGSDCYRLLVLDDYGDGMVDGGGGYIDLMDENGSIIISNDYSELAFTDDNSFISKFSLLSVSNIESLKSMNVFPNPASNVLNARFEILNDIDVQLEIFNVQGQSLVTLSNETFTSGVNEVSLDISSLSGGVYYLKATNDDQQFTRRFVVLD